MLSREKAEEILKNVYRAAGISPPDNCGEILRRGNKENIEKDLPGCHAASARHRMNSNLGLS